MSVKTVKSFVKGFVALVKGDDVAAAAEKAFRQASSGLKSQINSLEGDTVTFEDAVTDAKEAQSNARINNGRAITDRDEYVNKLLSAKNVVTQAESKLELHTTKIDFLKGELVALEQEVEIQEA